MKIFNIFKSVRPRKTILSGDFNGLQAALKASFDSLGDKVGIDAPAGHRGVSTPFHVGTPVDAEHAVNIKYFNEELAVVAEPFITTCTTEAARAVAAASTAAPEAAAQTALILNTQMDSKLQAAQLAQNQAEAAAAVTAANTAAAVDIHLASKVSDAQQAVEQAVEAKAEAQAVIPVVIEHVNTAGQHKTDAEQAVIDAQSVVAGNVFDDTKTSPILTWSSEKMDTELTLAKEKADSARRAASGPILQFTIHSLSGHH